MAFTDDPSPNDQFHDVGELVEVSVNVTVNGAVPVNGVAVKFATGEPEVDDRDIIHASSAGVSGSICHIQRNRVITRCSIGVDRVADSAFTDDPITKRPVP